MPPKVLEKAQAREANEEPTSASGSPAGELGLDMYGMREKLDRHGPQV